MTRSRKIYLCATSWCLFLFVAATALHFSIGYLHIENQTLELTEEDNNLSAALIEADNNLKAALIVLSIVALFLLFSAIRITKKLFYK
jgi:hypothetical protein